MPAVTLARRAGAVCVLAALALFVSAAAPRAMARDLSIQDFSEQVTVRADGTIDVTEIIEARFNGSWNGIYRTIPVNYTGAGGMNYKLMLAAVSATDEDGNSLKIERSTQGNNAKFKIWVPGAQDATKKILFSYRVVDAIRFSDEHDELYWNVTGDQWDVPIQSASAHIELPAGVTGLHAIAYTGAAGSRAQDAEVTISDNSVEIVANHRLAFHQGLTAVVGWDKGFVHQPTAAQLIALYLQSNWPLILIPIVLAIMLWLWWTRGRDPERGAVTVQYEPPDKLTPGECGTLVDNEVDMRDITATLVDLAVKGYLTIEQKDAPGMLGLTHHRDYIFHLKKAPAEWTAARPHEQQMLVALFGDGATPDVKLSDLQNHFYTQLPAIRDRIYDALMSDGYYLHRPDTVRSAYIGIGVALGFGSIFLCNFLGMATSTSPIAWIVAGVASGAIAAGFGWFMAARTLKGARTRELVLGFEEFLGRVEGDRIQRIEKTPELFEKFLPYAMALRVDKKWAQSFAGIAIQPPQWYSGSYGAGFMPYLLIGDLNAMSVQAGSAMASSPRSAGSSGFGGGGFSGGGFGGGGGGGF
ncbi:MAG: DUF2207 domain-containing protein [Candidatus Acidiferrales bacterium]